MMMLKTYNKESQNNSRNFNNNNKNTSMENRKQRNNKGNYDWMGSVGKIFHVIWDDIECDFMIININNIENNELVLFKKYIESEIQKDKTVIGIIISKTSKGKYNLIAIKPKCVEIGDIIKNV